MGSCGAVGLSRAADLGGGGTGGYSTPTGGTGYASSSSANQTCPSSTPMKRRGMSLSPRTARREFYNSYSLSGQVPGLQGCRYEEER